MPADFIRRYRGPKYFVAAPESVPFKVFRITVEDVIRTRFDGMWRTARQHTVKRNGWAPRNLFERSSILRSIVSSLESKGLGA